MLTDSQLVSRVQSGDEEAFAELARRHSPAAFRLATSILGPALVPEAEDVVQEAFWKAHQAISSFRGDAEFRSWIYRITFNQAVNLKERARFQRPHGDETALASIATRSPGPHEQALEAQRDLALAQCIATLPEVYQAALRLHYWLGASVAEAAELLDAPENTIKSYLHRARQLLAAMLRERGFADE